MLVLSLNSLFVLLLLFQAHSKGSEKIASFYERNIQKERVQTKSQQQDQFEISRKNVFCQVFPAEVIFASKFIRRNGLHNYKISKLG